MMLRVPWLLYFMVFAVLGIACLETVWLLVKGPALFFNTILFLSVYPLSSAVMIWVADLNRQRGQRLAWRGWLFMAAIPLFMLCGDFTLYRLEAEGQRLFPSAASIFYFAIFPWFFLAYRNFTGQVVSSLFVWQRRLDVMICVLAVAIYLWRFVFSPVALMYADNPGAFALFALSAVSLLIPISIVAITLWNEEPLAGVHRVAFAFAHLAYAAFIMLFFVQNYQGTFSTTNATVSISLWTLSLYCMSALLGLRHNQPYTVLSHLSSAFTKFRRMLPYLPYAAMMASFLLLLDPNLVRDAQDGLTLQKVIERGGVLLGSMFVSMLVVIRQILTMRENHRLNRELQAFSSTLEQRVEERTKQLEDSHARLAASERLASLGRISAGLAHEINTPVAAAMNSLKQAQHLAEEYEASITNADVTEADHVEIARELRQSLSTTDSSLDRLGEFVRRMRGQVRSSSGHHDFEAVRVVKDSLAMLEHRARKANVRLAFAEPAPLYFYGDAARFSQVVSNLVVNGLDACEDNLSSSSAVTVKLTASAEALILEVTDNGTGIPKDLQEKIFEPLFTTKDIGKGTGLGLAIIQDIVYGDFDGRIELESELGVGTVFRVLLPNKKHKAEVNL